MTIEELNKLSPEQARTWFNHCCASEQWCTFMLSGLPYRSLNTLYQSAVSAWSQCSYTDFLEAFEGHPMIGDVDSLRAKYAATKTLASTEQQGANSASEDTLKQLLQLNHEYLERHGFIFIICATGLSAETMLQELKIRLLNDTPLEIKLAAAEQLKITQLRLHKGLTQ